ncbi:MAG: exonuclease SbcCD subunit D C-terminal domain-containing protein [Planctomycetota bacterium]
MRILHTADWHLGHTLREHARDAEHAAFLRWLVATCAERAVDVLCIAGDVFDSANPPPAAWRQWFEFLGALKRGCPAIQVVVIAGNHDSPARLEAPHDLLAAFDVRVIGRVERDANGAIRTERLLVPLRAPDGEVAALCVAIPFLRGADVVLPPAAAAAEPAGDALPRPGGPAVADTGDAVVAGMRALHGEVFAAARARLLPGQALVAMAHGYLVGGMLSELSERKVLGGNQHALPIDLFPDDCAYVAVGHLHRPQPIAGREHVRYCGSPLPLSMPEREHAHHVVFADLEAGRLAKTWSLRVPRLVSFVRIPERGELTPDEALAQVAALPARDDATAAELRPFLEVAVRLAEPSPNLGEKIAQACANRDVRLVKVEQVLTGRGEEPGAGAPAELDSLQPEEVFGRLYARSHEGQVPEPLLAAFRELLEEVEQGGEE